MLVANLGLALTVIAWGSTAPVLNELLRTWDPMVLTTVRFMMSSCVFLTWLWISEKRSLVLTGQSRLQIVWISVILASFVILLTFAIQYSNPINVSIIGAASPVVAAFVNRALTGSNPPRSILFALPVVVLGGVFSGTDLAAFGSGDALFQFEPGDGLMLIAIVLWPTYSALLQRWFDGASQLRRTTYSFCGATCLLIPVSVAIIALGVESLPAEVPDLKGWGYVIWTSLATSILGTYFWNVGVEKLGIIVGAMILNFIPMVAIVVSMMFGLEPRIEQLFGVGLVIAGVAGAQYGARRARLASPIGS